VTLPTTSVRFYLSASLLVDGSLGLVFSQSVLLALVASGLSRDDAYRIVQRDARQAWEERRALRAVLEDDPEVALGPGALDGAFDLHRLLRHAGRAVDALGALGVEGAP